MNPSLGEHRIQVNSRPHPLVYFAAITQKRSDPGAGRRHNVRYRALGDHMTAFGTSHRPHFHQMVHRCEHARVMVDHHHRITVGHQIAHHAQQTIHIRRMQADRRLVQHIQHARGAIAHRTRQLYTLPLAGGQRRTGAIE